MNQLDKLTLLRKIELPPRLFDRLSLRIVKAYRRRAVVEEVHELRRQPPSGLSGRLRGADQGHRAGPWLETVAEGEVGGQERINRIAYEVCVLLALRDHLRSKQIWIEVGNRYRNPDEDLPVDFDQERFTYYTALKLPETPDAFIDGLKRQMREAMTGLPDGLPANEYVKIEDRDRAGSGSPLWKFSQSP